MPVCSRISKATCSNFTKFSIGLYVARGRTWFSPRLTIMRIRCVLTTSGFVDDVMYLHNGHV